ncbi:unnamed protein product [Discula destructiva]
MEKDALKWLAGEVPPNLYKAKPRPFEEMSDKGEMSDDGHENGEKSAKGAKGVNGEDDTEDQSSTIRCLPGCTRGKDHKEPWEMSIYHVQAYMSMRGSAAADEDDPMLKWMAEQDRKRELKAAEKGMQNSDEEDEKPKPTGIFGKVKEGEKKPKPKGIFAGARDSIKMDFDWKMHGPAKYDDEDGDRPTSFQYPRPKIEHLCVPDLLNEEYLEEMFQKHTEAGGGWSKFVNDYCSDDGDDPENGRISPCTFNRWAEGAKRWDAPADKFKSMMEERKEFEIPAERQRCESPSSPETRERKVRFKKNQVDERDGMPMSPICSEYANTSPSVLWSPPPMRAKIPQAMQKDQMFRMDPELAVALREGHKDAVMGSADSYGVDEIDEAAVAVELRNLNISEVNTVVDKYWGAEKTFNTIAQKQRDLAHLNYHEGMVNGANDRYRHAALALKHDNRKLIDCLKKLHRNREMRIMKLVDGQMRELEYEGKVKLAEIEAQIQENEELRLEYEREKDLQARLLAKFGKETADEVFGMYPDVWEPLEKRKNYRNSS